MFKFISSFLGGRGAGGGEGQERGSFVTIYRYLDFFMELGLGIACVASVSVRFGSKELQGDK